MCFPWAKFCNSSGRKFKRGDKDKYSLSEKEELGKLLQGRTGLIFNISCQSGSCHGCFSKNFAKFFKTVILQHTFHLIFLRKWRCWLQIVLYLSQKVLSRINLVAKQHSFKLYWNWDSFCLLETQLILLLRPLFIRFSRNLITFLLLRPPHRLLNFPKNFRSPQLIRTTPVYLAPKPQKPSMETSLAPSTFW